MSSVRTDLYPPCQVPLLSLVLLEEGIKDEG